MEIHTWLVEAGGAVGAAHTFFKQTVGIHVYALLLAVLTPLLLIYGRHEIRLRRLRSLKDFLWSYGKTPVATHSGDANTSQKENTQLIENPSYEFVKSKYISDLSIKAPADGPRFDDLDEVDQIDLIIDSIGHFGTASDWKIFLSTIGFILLSYIGFSALGTTLTCGLDPSACDCRAPSAASACANALGGFGKWAEIVAIGSLAFAGAFIAALRTFVRSVAVFDLSPYTFLRHTAEIIASVIFTIVLYLAFRDPVATLQDLGSHVFGTGTPQPAGATPTPPPTTALAAIPLVWFGLAPLLGLLPQSATKFLLIKLQSLISWIKTSDDRFVKVTKISSLDIIDGIDYEIRFRLEECGIYDVQNLATYNPIMLHIESPYGIYQVIDWIAQAQLCHILGPEKFLIFRELNIRTIFDLERAIGGEDASPVFDEICAGVLFASTENLKKTLDIGKTKLIVQDANGARAVEADDYCLWARNKLQGANDAQATEHVLRWIADDLHVRRLRRLWLDICTSLGPDSEHLPDVFKTKREATVPAT